MIWFMDYGLWFIDTHSRYTIYHTPFTKLSYFQSHYRKYHTQNRYNPKSRNYLAFIISKFLIMMMQRAHQKNSLALTKFSSLCI